MKKVKETPLMKQYNSIKAKHPDALLLFRVGDFYETFADDAVKTAKILNIILTKRSNGSAGEVPLAGFPHHSLETYLPKLVRAGYRVAICDQLEDPKDAVGIVKRGVTDLVSPGVVLSDKVLESKENNFLMAIHENKKKWGWSLIDVSTGEFLISEGNEADLCKDLDRFNPKEILVSKNKTYPAAFAKQNLYVLPDWLYYAKYAKEKLEGFFQVKSLKGFAISDCELGQIAAASILYYLTEVHSKKLTHINNIKKIEGDTFVRMDNFTIRNLELINSLNHNAVVLKDIIDKTMTPVGARLLTRWILFPLKEKTSIENRLSKVDFFTKHQLLLEKVREDLKSITDLERLLSKISNLSISPRQLSMLSYSLKKVIALKAVLQKGDEDNSWDVLLKNIKDLNEIYNSIDNCLVEDPPVSVQKGNFVKRGFNEELDNLNDIVSSANSNLDAILDRERSNTGISSLKIAFNNVFGYYLEVRNTHKDKVPETWQRKQTLVNAERYITEELKQYEVQILSAKEKIEVLEKSVYVELVKSIEPYFADIQNIARTIANIDCLASHSKVALDNNYTKPILSNKKEIEIKDGRHPVIEKQLPKGETYISNSLFLDSEKQQIIMLTGPNMSGKSAVLRQTALMVLMAQIGSFVPAKYAKLGLVDRIFTRVGASDNISQGESTFMVEMNEAACILNNLSENSLVILDEIGRGTATYDGISIAWAIAQYTHEHPWRPLTLFATHYHELNEMEKNYERIKNFTISIKEDNGSILFLRKLIPGCSAHSFGIEVAKMAGMPKEVVRSATNILRSFDQGENKKILSDKNKQDTYDDMQLSFFKLDDPILEELRKEISNLDINTLTPVEALLKLQTIKNKIGD